MFSYAVAHGWNPAQGGLCYTLGWDDQQTISAHYRGPLCKSMDAADAPALFDISAALANRWRRFWDVTPQRFKYHAHAGWKPQIDADGLPTSDSFFGKPDLRHALQVCLVPLVPVTGSIATFLRAE